MIVSFRRKYLNVNRFFELSLVIILLLSFLYYYFYRDNYNLVTKNESTGLMLFYHSQMLLHFSQIFTVIIFVSPNIFSTEIVDEKRNHFSYLIKQRIGRKNYFRSNLLLNSLYSFIFMVLLQFFMILFIHLFLAPIDFNFVQGDLTGVDYPYNFFDSNFLYNILIYICFSSIGFAIFSDLVYEMNLIIKNKYICKGSGLILGLLLSTVPVIASGTFSEKIFHNQLFIYIFSPTYLPFLIMPSSPLMGGFHLHLPMIVIYILCVTCYLLVISILHKYNSRMESLYE